MGGLKTRIETDFYYNAGTPLRHAYASLGPVLAGQTWTTLMDENTYADTIDFEGPVAWSPRAFLSCAMPRPWGRISPPRLRWRILAPRQS